MAVIGERVDAELVTRPRDFQEGEEGSQVLKGLGGANGDPTATCQPQVVAGLGLHRFEKFLFALADVEDDSAGRLKASRRAEAEGSHALIYIGFLDVVVQGNVRLYFEENRASFACRRVNFAPEGSLLLSIYIWR